MFFCPRLTMSVLLLRNTYTCTDVDFPILNTRLACSRNTSIPLTQMAFLLRPGFFYPDCVERGGVCYVARAFFTFLFQ